MKSYDLIIVGGGGFFIVRLVDSGGHRRRAFAAGRLGIGAAEVRVVSSEEVTWRDASLGCPQPGMNYAQMLTNGTRIVLEAAGKQYNYHSGSHGAPFLCADPQPPLSTAT